MALAFKVVLREKKKKRGKDVDVTLKQDSHKLQVAVLAHYWLMLVILQRLPAKEGLKMQPLCR